MVQSCNLYAYGINNPVFYFDKGGEAVTAYGFFCEIGIGGTGYEGMYLWATDNGGNFALLSVNGYITGIGGSVGGIIMTFPTMPSIYSMYGYVFGINATGNGWGAGVTFSGDSGQYQGYIAQAGVGLSLNFGADGSYTSPIISGNINNIGETLKKIINKFLPDSIKL